MLRQYQTHNFSLKYQAYQFQKFTKLIQNTDSRININYQKPNFKGACPGIWTQNLSHSKREIIPQ